MPPKFLDRAYELPVDYAKALAAYHADCTKIEHARAALVPIRERTLELMETKGITAYAICKDLGLNKGNVYAYLRGDLTKVSAKTGRAVYSYARAA